MTIDGITQTESGELEDVATEVLREHVQISSVVTPPADSDAGTV